MSAAYCTPLDIRNNVAGTDAGTGTCAQLTDDQMNEAIARASAKVSAYAGTSWVVDAADPVIVVPDLISSVTVAIATYYATLTYRKGKDLTAQDPVYLGYLDANQTLKDIASGLISPVPVAPNDPPERAGHIRNTIPRIFDGANSGTERDGRGGIIVAGAPGSGLIDNWRRN